MTREGTAGLTTRRSAWRDVLLIGLAVVALRLPFLNQAVGGDDVYYLAAAYHSLIDPAHPNHTWYVFEGRDVTFQGYPHPPGNAWVLGGLLAIFHDVREIPFHAFYIVFSLMAAWGMYGLARRFSERPLWATALFLVVPAFVVNGNSFESDLPLLGFWMAGAAAFVYAVDRNNRKLLTVAALLLSAAALVAMQSIVFSAILLAYLYLTRRFRWGSVAVALSPLLMLAAWQIFERLTSGQFPLAVSAGYLSSYGLERIPMKLRNVAALTIHACFVVFPILLPFAAREAWRRRREPDTRFLAAWCALFLAAAYVLFYSGSARYLLPMAAPIAILAARAPLAWLRAGVAIQLAVSISLATVNFEHWNAYRAFAQSIQSQTKKKRVWVDAEWGLRHYLEADGALPLHRDQWVPTGDIVVTSQLAFPAPYGHGGRVLTPVAASVVAPWLPTRLIGLGAKSGYSTDSEGLLPYDVRGGVIDRIEADELRAHEPDRTQLPMDDAADAQILFGVYAAEGRPWRWMAGEAGVLLKTLGGPAVLELKLYIPDAAPARTVKAVVRDGPTATRTFPGPGAYTWEIPVDTTRLAPVDVTLSVDRTFEPPGDRRSLGIVLNSAGLRPPR